MSHLKLLTCGLGGRKLLPPRPEKRPRELDKVAAGKIGLDSKRDFLEREGA